MYTVKLNGQKINSKSIRKCKFVSNTAHNLATIHFKIYIHFVLCEIRARNEIYKVFEQWLIFFIVLFSCADEKSNLKFLNSN